MQLQSFARSRSLPAALCARARIVLSSADGKLNSTIAERLQLTKATVGKWRTRFIDRRIAGLHDDVRPGKPRTIDDEQAQLINTTLHTRPADGSTHWSVRTAAAKTGISKTSVARYFQLFGLQPHRSEGFKLSNDPFFIEKLRDVVGLYLSPPDNALVICVDEKSQCQALERTQPMLPMGFGYVEGRYPRLQAPCHDYIVRRPERAQWRRTGNVQATPLAPGVPGFPARDRQGGAARAGHPLHRGQLPTHSRPKLKAWLATRLRWNIHFIPTYSSWLNQVERFFALITDKAIRRGSFTSVKQLI